MKISFLIVTRNRPDELAFTLNKLKDLIDLSLHEVIVFIDGCSKTERMISQFKWVQWTVSKQHISASPARQELYKKAKGEIFIGLDDDAHPISDNFIHLIQSEFDKNHSLGILACQEVRGIFVSDRIALKHAKENETYFTNDFVGCGFAIKKEVYTATNGFPIWMNIYGEESALSIEVLDLGYQILYNSSIIVNHRIDIAKRKMQGRNYYRFEHQLKNSIRYYLVYFPNPIYKITKLLLHNFRKYAFSDFKYFKLYFKVCLSTFFQIFSILKFRMPVKTETLNQLSKLRTLKY